MSELSNDAAVMKIARKAFLEESGAALIKKYSNLNDELFTKSGYENYAEDLLERMTNPYLSDAVERAARDPIRKLGYNDRIFGTMRLALEYGIEPVNMAKAAGAGLGYLLKNARINNVPENLRNNKDVGPLLAWLWNGQTGEYSDELVQCVREALFFDIKTLP
jgi:mannitol-1-phosphate/altronate dehydrogenase